MRYVDRITFATESESGYNPETGNHDEASVVEKVFPCNLSPLGTDRTEALFGELEIIVLVARLQRPHNEVFDYVEVNEERMTVKRHVKHRRESVLYLEGVRL